VSICFSAGPKSQRFFGGLDRRRLPDPRERSLEPLAQIHSELLRVLALASGFRLSDSLEELD
jgi:hypothetical protein